MNITQLAKAIKLLADVFFPTRSLAGIKRSMFAALSLSALTDFAFELNIAWPHALLRIGDDRTTVIVVLTATLAFLIVVDAIHMFLEARRTERLWILASTPGLDPAVRAALLKLLT